jgi:SHS2 domain-containing protein
VTDAAPAGHQYFEVEADVGVQAWGESLCQAFAQAALAAFALIVDPSEVQAVETREVRAQGDSREALLVAWINECIYVHEIEGFVVRRVEVNQCEGSVAHGVLHGEEFDRDRHRPGTLVKAATLHGITVTEHQRRWEVRVVLDI